MEHSKGVSTLMSMVAQAWRWTVRRIQSLRPGLRRQPTETDLPTYNARTATSAGNDVTRTEPAGLLYLLYCTSTGAYGVKFHQNLIHEKLNDRELFLFLRTIYCRARKETKWFTLRTTTNISLCKV